jgi:hypothetical protein
MGKVFAELLGPSDMALSLPGREEHFIRLRRLHMETI